MEIIHNIDTLHSWRNGVKQAVVGFVPTMGALHEGHTRLVRAALETCDVVIVSIFVNQLQFNNHNDFEKYPNTLAADVEKLKKVGCHALFVPSAQEMYPKQDSSISISFGHIEQLWEGAMRPGHFNGVGIVLTKLFHLINPQKAYFGEKDLQQLRIVQLLVRELNFLIEIVPCAIARENDGLAMSSRNVRLSPKERALAPAIYSVLQTMIEELVAGLSVIQCLAMGKDKLASYSAFQLEYLSIVNPESLKEIQEYDNHVGAAIIIAVWLGETRLIDNILIKPSDNR